MENDIPKGWVETNLEVLQTLVIGGDWGQDLSLNDDDFVISKVIRGTDFKKWQEDKSRNSAIRKIKKSSLEKRLLKSGDIILEVSGGGPDQPVGRTIIIDQTVMANEQIPLICSNFFRKISLSRLVNPYYVNYYLSYCYSKGAYNDIQTHTTNLRNLRVDQYLNSQVLFPPFAEQNRIVNTLDVALNRLAASRKRFDSIPAKLKNFRQSVLNTAVNGELTSFYRKSLKSNNELPFFKDDFTINDKDYELNDIPTSWKWIALGNYGKCNRGKFSIRPRNDPRYFSGKHPFIQIGDLPREGGLIKTHQQTLNEEGLKVSRMFPKNTVVVAIVGATIGNTGILSYNMCFTDSLVGINTSNEISNQYIEYYLRTQKNIIRNSSYASGGQPNINLETLNTYPFPLPPFEEQKEIVRKVEELFHFADQIEARYNKAKQWFDKIPQSILAKAFRGELVPQDENDEPASELLNRIQEEKKTKMETKPPKKEIKKGKGIKIKQ